MAVFRKAKSYLRNIFRDKKSTMFKKNMRKINSNFNFFQAAKC